VVVMAKRPRTILPLAEGEYLFSGVRPSSGPSSGAAGLSAGEITESSCVFGVETLLLPRTAALRLTDTRVRAGVRGTKM